MATKTNSPATSPVSAPAGAIVQSQEVIDSVLANAGPAEDVSADSLAIEKAFANMSTADFAKRLDAVTAAKPTDFKANERDFWKPIEAGQPQELRGVYLGSAKAGRLTQHAFAVKGESGKPLAMRVNGAHGLTREIAKLTVGDAVLVEFKGQTGTMSGNKFGQWVVSKLKA